MPVGSFLFMAGQRPRVNEGLPDKPRRDKGQSTPPEF